MLTTAANVLAIVSVEAPEVASVRVHGIPNTTRGPEPVVWLTLDTAERRRVRAVAWYPESANGLDVAGWEAIRGAESDGQVRLSFFPDSMVLDIEVEA